MVYCCLLRVIINQHHSEILSVLLAGSLRRELGCTQLNTWTVLYNIVTLSAELVTCLLSPLLSHWCPLGIPHKSAHSFQLSIYTAHECHVWLPSESSGRDASADGWKYEYSFVYENRMTWERPKCSMQCLTVINWTIAELGHVPTQACVNGIQHIRQSCHLLWRWRWHVCYGHLKDLNICFHHH